MIYPVGVIIVLLRKWIESRMISAFIKRKKENTNE